MTIRETRKSYINNLFKGLTDVDPLPESFPKVIEIMRKEGLLTERAGNSGPDISGIYDVTRQSLTFPAGRSATLQSMARGETGGLLLLAYSNMRGYGDIHPTVGELRVGYIPVRIKHPYSSEPYTVGEVKITEAEVIAKFTANDGSPQFTLGYGLCFGHNETKAISMAILDRAMQAEGKKMPSARSGICPVTYRRNRCIGFCAHWKLPHYVTFQSDLDRLRKARESWNFCGSPKAGIEE